MIKITLEFTTLAAAIAAMSSLNGAVANVTSISDTAVGNATPAATVDAPKADTSAPAASSQKPAESPANPASAGTTLTYDADVRPLVLKVGAAGKRDALVELLAKFNAPKGPDLKPEQLPAFKSALEALLA